MAKKSNTTNKPAKQSEEAPKDVAPQPLPPRLEEKDAPQEKVEEETVNNAEQVTEQAVKEEPVEEQKETIEEKPAAKVQKEDDDDDDDDEVSLRLIGKDQIPDVVEPGRIFVAGFNKALDKKAKLSKKEAEFTILGEVGVFADDKGKPVHKYLVQYKKQKDAEDLKAPFFRGVFEEA
jgi:hypothetical protein